RRCGGWAGWLGGVAVRLGGGPVAAEAPAVARRRRPAPGGARAFPTAAAAPRRGGSPARWRARAARDARGDAHGGRRAARLCAARLLDVRRFRRARRLAAPGPSKE